MLTQSKETIQSTVNNITPSHHELKKMITSFVPTPMTVSTASLSPNDVQALVKLIEAACIMNDIYMEQLWSSNSETFMRLQSDTSDITRTALHYFWLNKSPWSALDGKSFVSGVLEAKPKGANFYPVDMSKLEFEEWVKTLNEEQQKQARSSFTIIRRAVDGELLIIPYNKAYKQPIESAATLLRDAARLTSNVTLRNFLMARADALQFNDYYASDVAWVDLDTPIDVMIGPIETYDDELLGYKASYAAYINLRDDAETAKLSFFSKYLQEIEDNLPIDPKYRNSELAKLAPISVVNEIFSSGQGARGVQVAAYNLPNDERIIAEKGAKRVMLKNMQEAKFNSILIPLAQLVLAPDELKNLSFDAFFTHMLAHELCHGLGPQKIMVNGTMTTPHTELKELYSAIEEDKADVTGLFALQYLLDKQAAGKIPAGTIAITERELYTTYFASMFRTLRFGIKGAHGCGMALQFNYLLDQGAITCEPNGTFSLVWEKIKSAFSSLDHDLLTIEATGDYVAAKKLLETMTVVTPELEAALAKLAHLPTDIEPIFVTAKKLVPQIIESGAEFEKTKVLQKKPSFFQQVVSNDLQHKESYDETASIDLIL